MNSNEVQWRLLVLAGLRLCRHLEQNLDDWELTVVLEGWPGPWARRPSAPTATPWSPGPWTTS
jgi:hypothetical protein